MVESGAEAGCDFTSRHRRIILVGVILVPSALVFEYQPEASRDHLDIIPGLGQSKPASGHSTGSNERAPGIRYRERIDQHPSSGYQGQSRFGLWRGSRVQQPHGVGIRPKYLNQTVYACDFDQPVIAA